MGKILVNAAQIPNWQFNTNASTGHDIAIFMASVIALRASRSGGLTSTSHATHMSTLILRRKKTAWQDLGRDYCVILDDKEVAQVSNGEQIEISISEGKHVVQMQIDWCQSEALKIDVAIGETQILECGPNSKPWLALLYVTVLRRKYLWLRRVNSSPEKSDQRTTFGSR